jgi:asparagine N-glycosylation enzyme membrane subunit Stt3
VEPDTYTGVNTAMSSTFIKVTFDINQIADPVKLQRAITNKLKMTGEAARVDFVATTNTWNHKPKFVASIVDPETVAVGTDDAVWGMLDVGTKPHIIRVKRAKALRFAWNGFGSYGAKTRPGFLGSKNAKYPTTINYRKQVKHPGTKARIWTGTAIIKYQKLLPTIVQRAISVEMNTR